MKIKYVIVLVAIFATTSTVAFIRNQSVVPEPVYENESEQRTEQKMDTLTEWQLFTLALIEVESENDSLAISVKDARGILQLTQIYIEDVNRLTDWNLNLQDAHDNQTALICFDTIQGHYNPERDIERAIYLHNPNAGPWYKRRIMDKMADIRRREQVRTLIITY